MATFNNNDEKLLKSIDTIFKRPGMFLYPINIDSLDNFINGYIMAMVSGTEQGRVDFFIEGNPSFNRWVVEKYHGEYLVMGWATAIKEHISSDLGEINEGEDIQIFKTLLDEYVAMRRKQKE